MTTLRRPAGALQDWCVRASSAAWGFALAAAMASHLQRRAVAGQLPGAMTAQGLDPAGPFLQLAALIVFSFACALAGTFLVRCLAGAPRWAGIACCTALAGAPLSLLVGGRLAGVALQGAIAAAAVVAGQVARIGPTSRDCAAPAGEAEESLLRRPAAVDGEGAAQTPGRRRSGVRPRNPRSRLSRWDLLLVPTALSCYFAVLDLAPAGSRPVTCFLVAVIATLALRLAVGGLSALRRPGLALAPAPLAVLLQLQWLPPAGAAAAALLWIAATPLVIASLVCSPEAERRLPAAVAFAVYPLFAFAYPLALLGIASPPHVDFFEDGHELLPASEMLRGARPYADIVPLHGLISDGGLEFLVMKSGHVSAGELLRVRRIAGCANVVAIYAVAFAASGAAEAGLLAVLLSVTLFPAMTLGLRPAMALFALAGAAAATRLRSRRWFAAAGAAVILAFLFSLDLAIYSGLAAAAAALRSTRCGRALAALAAGAAVAAVAILAAFTAMGFAGAFLRTTFLEVLTAGPVYVPGPFAVPACVQTLATALPSWTQPECVSSLLWVFTVVATSAAIARAPLGARRGDGVWSIGVWVAVAGVSYAERRHFYADFAIPAFIVGALFLLARRRAKHATLALALVIGWLANPLGHIFAVATPLRLSGGVPPGGGVEWTGGSRGRGALLEPGLRTALDAAGRFAGARLRPGETWFDFTNHAALYYFLARRCPARHPEIPFVESEAAQREVIAALDRDTSVRAALVGFPDWFSAIDEVPNRVRAPLIWRYLQDHFTPGFEDHGVVFWVRK
jgi:hypothetical protein